ncbi:MAG: hypothetical protein GC134_07875 [Proteobacteria bacterium]|nr:hypothetical protein [Pseudomonadota bacterium]
MHGRRLDQTPKAFFTFMAADGERVALVVRNSLSDLPFWFCHNGALFDRQTPDEVRTELFNAVLDANDKDRPAGSIYAEKVRLRKGYKGKEYFHIHLTAVGEALVRSTATSTSVREFRTSGSVDASVMRQLTDDMRFALRDMGY